jgi:hypothetical protein
MDNGCFVRVETARKPFFEDCEFSRQISRGKQRFAHFHKRADNKDAHLNGAGAVQNIGSLESSMFRERPRAVCLAAVFA